MKKLLFVAAIAMCVMSCGKKAENTENTEACQQEAAQVEEVAAPVEEQPAEEENAVVNAVEQTVEATEAVQEAVAQ